MLFKRAPAIFAPDLPQREEKILRLTPLVYLLFFVLFSRAVGAAGGDITVRAGKVLDITTGDYRYDQVIAIANGRIQSVAPFAQAQVDRGARYLNLSEYTVLPGLIDAHTHLFADADIQGYESLRISLPHAVIKGVKNALITLQQGFTTVRVVGAPAYADVALREAIDGGEVPGPRLMVAGPAIGITGGHCSDNNLLPFEYLYKGEGVADGPWAVRQKVRQHVKYGVDLIKTCSTGGVLSKGTKTGAPQYTLEELKALVDEAHMHGRKVAVHAHGAEGIKNAILAGADSIEHASYIDKEGIRLAKKMGTYLVMDIYVTEYILSAGKQAGFTQESLDKEKAVGATQRRNFTRAHKAGVRMAYGTDTAVFPHDQAARQFSRMVEFGMTPLQAIQSATLHGARLLGMEADVGVIAAGYFGDLVATRGDPLVDISVLEQVEYVVKGGEVYVSSVE